MALIRQQRWAALLHAVVPPNRILGPDARRVVLAGLIALIAAVPLAVMLGALWVPEVELWQHLFRYTLPTLLRNTSYIGLGVGGGVLLLGVPLAWLTAVYTFPGRHFFNWALMLPLAMPAYVMAFSQLGLFDFSGPLQTLLRQIGGNSSWVPDIRSAPGVILVMSLAFYPYVYLLARNAFATMGRRALEVGQSFGLSRSQAFWLVALPMARPWIVGGMMLALMEALADFGTAAIFNFDTFTTAIYQAWFSLFSLPAAQQLSSLLVLLILGLVWLEQRSRGQRAYTQAGQVAPLSRLALTTPQRWGATALCSLVLLLGFILPFGQILLWAGSHWVEGTCANLAQYLLNSVLLALLATLLVVSVAVCLSYLQRCDHGRWVQGCVQVATLGYAVPGMVLAVGVFVPIAWLDNQLIAMLHMLLPTGTTTLLKGTLLVMCLAYIARFLAVGHTTVNTAMLRITQNQEAAARNLGYSGILLLWRVHLPLLRGGLLTAALIVFVDVMKEMPITLMTRPYGWDTLAVNIFNLTTEGEWERAALPAVAIVLAGLIPIMLLSQQKPT